jgi:hypothetical protein
VGQAEMLNKIPEKSSRNFGCKETPHPVVNPHNSMLCFVPEWQRLVPENTSADNHRQVTKRLFVKKKCNKRSINFINYNFAGINKGLRRVDSKRKKLSE